VADLLVSACFQIAARFFLYLLSAFVPKASHSFVPKEAGHHAQADEKNPDAL
jgi:hypothetical protein